MRRLVFALAVAGIATGLAAQVGGGPIDAPPSPPRGGNGGNGGGFGGIGLSISLGKKKPKVKTLEQRDVSIPDHLADQVVFFISGQEAEANRIARAAAVTVIEVARLDAIAQTMVVAQLAAGDTVEAAIARLEPVRGVAWAQPNQLFQPLGKSLPKRFNPAWHHGERACPSLWHNRDDRYAGGYPP